MIRAGVKNLKAFGYPGVNSENILTDHIYREFFKAQLEATENYGINSDIEAVRLKILAELEQPTQ